MDAWFRKKTSLRYSPFRTGLRWVATITNAINISLESVLTLHPNKADAFAHPGPFLFINELLESLYRVEEMNRVQLVLYKNARVKAAVQITDVKIPAIP